MAAVDSQQKPLAHVQPDQITDNHHGTALTSSADDHAASTIHNGEIYPTEDERATLRYVADSIPWAAWLVVAVEFGAPRFYLFERLFVSSDLCQNS